MAKKSKDDALPVISLSDNEEDYLANLTGKKASAFLKAIHEYRDRLIALVLVPARKDAEKRDAIERMFQKVRTEAGEVAAATYVRLFYPELNTTFWDEVETCFAENDTPRKGRKAMYKTDAWMTEVAKTQKLIQYPLHK